LKYDIVTIFDLKYHIGRISKIKFQYQNHINITFGIQKRTLEAPSLARVWVGYFGFCGGLNPPDPPRPCLQNSYYIKVHLIFTLSLGAILSTIIFMSKQKFSLYNKVKRVKCMPIFCFIKFNRQFSKQKVLK